MDIHDPVRVPWQGPSPCRALPLHWFWSRANNDIISVYSVLFIPACPTVCFRCHFVIHVLRRYVFCWLWDDMFVQRQKRAQYECSVWCVFVVFSYSEVGNKKWPVLPKHTRRMSVKCIMVIEILLYRIVYTFYKL